MCFLQNTFMPDLTHRSHQKELMDDLTLASDALRQNLDELEFINTTLGGYKVLTSALEQLRKENKLENNFTLVDIGSGGGDTLRSLLKWVTKKNISARFIGLDANEFMINYAQERTNTAQIKFAQANVFDLDDHLDFDWATMSLFCHHFTNEELITIFRNVYRASKKGFIINDLHRHFLAYYSIYFLTRLFRGSYLVKHDAPLSVWRGFRKQELVDLLEKAGIKNYRIIWKWAFRFQVIVEKEAD